MNQPAGLYKKKAKRRHYHAPKKFATGATKSEINVTPLVDVVLVLLIIFMVVTPMLHRGVAVELPETVHHKKKQDSGDILVVTVAKDGSYIDRDKLQGEMLQSRLKTELVNKGRAIHLRGDKSLRYGDVRKVLDELHAAGATSVALATEETKK